MYRLLEKAKCLGRLKMEELLLEGWKKVSMNCFNFSNLVNHYKLVHQGFVCLFELLDHPQPVSSPFIVRVEEC